MQAGFFYARYLPQARGSARAHLWDYFLGCLPAQQLLLEAVARALVVRDCALDQRVVTAHTQLLALTQRLVMATQGLARAEDRQVIAVKQPKVLVVADDDAWRQRIVLQQVAAEEGRLVAQVD